MICPPCQTNQHKYCKGCDCQHRTDQSTSLGQFIGGKRVEIPVVADPPDTLTVTVHNSNGIDLFYCGRADNHVDDKNMDSAKSDHSTYRLVSQMVTGAFRITVEQQGE